MDSILFVSNSVPGARAYGSDTRISRVLRWFHEREIRVHYVQLTRRLVGMPPKISPEFGLASFHELHVAGDPATDNEPLGWKRITRSRSSFFQRYWSDHLRAHKPVQDRIAELLRETKSTILWVDHTALAPAAPDPSKVPGILRIVDTHDIIYQRDATLSAEGIPPEEEFTCQNEQRLLSSFDVIVAIQNRERQELERMLPGKTVITVGHAVEVAPQPCSTADLCFVGSQYRVNEVNLLKFIRGAWPAIREQCPLTKLQIAGGVGECEEIAQAAKLDSRILVRGIVPRIADIYSGPAVIVCPLWSGSGLKIKVVEALAHGKAVVATQIASQGLEDGIGTAFQLAREPQDFIAQVVPLLQNAQLRSQFELGAIHYAQEHFQEQPVWKEMEQFLDLGRNASLRAVAA